MKRSSVIKAVLFSVFVIFSIYLVKYSSLSGYISREYIRSFVDTFGVWAPLAYILLYIVGICLFVPGTPITAAGGIIFGTVWGFIYTMIGAMIGSTAAFWIARFLGYDAVASLTKGSLEKYQKFLEKEGFGAVFYMRLLYVPFTASNFACGLVKIKFKDFFWGTFLGIIPGTFIFTFFFDSISSITSFADLLQWQVVAAVVLFLFSFSIPVLVKKWKKNRNLSGN